MDTHKNASLTPKGREQMSSRRGGWRHVRGHRGQTTPHRRQSASGSTASSLKGWMVCMIDPPVNPKPERNTSSIQFDVHCARRSGLMMTSILTALSALGTRLHRAGGRCADGGARCLRAATMSVAGAAKQNCAAWPTDCPRGAMSALGGSGRAAPKEEVRV